MSTADCFQKVKTLALLKRQRSCGRSVVLGCLFGFAFLVIFLALLRVPLNMIF